jgi:hypothetical protein
MSLGNTVLQLFCYKTTRGAYIVSFSVKFGIFTLALSKVCVQCPMWLFSVVP